jgi:hypothetical protein
VKVASKKNAKGSFAVSFWFLPFHPHVFFQLQGVPKRKGLDIPIREMKALLELRKFHSFFWPKKDKSL